MNGQTNIVPLYVSGSATLDAGKQWMATGDFRYCAFLSRDDADDHLVATRVAAADRVTSDWADAVVQGRHGICARLKSGGFLFLFVDAKTVDVSPLGAKA